MRRKGGAREESLEGQCISAGPDTVGTCLSCLVFRKRSRSCRGHHERSSSTFGETTSLEQVLRHETRGIKYPEHPPLLPSSRRGYPLTGHALKPRTGRLWTWFARAAAFVTPAEGRGDKDGTDPGGANQEYAAHTPSPDISVANFCIHSRRQSPHVTSQF